MTLQIISSDDDNWDDIGIDDNSFMYRTSRGISTYCPDKDLLRACRTVLSPSSFSDDDDTISTSTSLQSIGDQDYSFSEMGDLGTPPHGGMSSPYTTKMQPRNLLSLSVSSSSSKLEYGNYDSNSTFSRNNSLFDLIKDYEGRGTITRLGRTTGSVQVDIGDWSQDLDLPPELKLSTKLGSSSNTETNQQPSTTVSDDDDPFDDLPDDDIFTADSSTIESSSQKQTRFDQMTPAPQGDADFLEQQRQARPIITTAPSLSLHQQRWKVEEDDEGFDDIDIPNDISTRSFKPHHHAQTNVMATTVPTTTTPTSSSNGNRTGYKSSPLPPHIQKQFGQFKETDTDDFLDGLDIKDGIFKATPSNIINKKGGSPMLESKLPRPKRYQQQQQRQQQQQQSKPTTVGQHSSSRKKSTPHENRLDRLTAPTYASRQRGTNITPTMSSLSSSALRTTRQHNNPPHSHWEQLKPQTGTLSSAVVRSSNRYQSSQHSHFTTTRYNNATAPTSAPFIRTSDGSTLMTRPRTGRLNYGNGSELDHLDDLAVWKKTGLTKPLMKTTRHSDGSRNESAGTISSTRKSDMSSKPWRCNMSTRKMTLIKPDEQKVVKEINDMRYDDKERRWHGNEQATQPFDTPARRRPALIKNNMRHSRATKSTSALVVGNMTFDQQKMSWNTHNGDEVDVLAHIDDLSEDETQPSGYHHQRLRTVTGVANHDQGTSNPTSNNHNNNNMRYGTHYHHPHLHTSTAAPFENNSTTSILHTESAGSSSRSHRTDSDIINTRFKSCLDTTTDMSTATASSTRPSNHTSSLLSSSSSSSSNVFHQHYFGQNRIIQTTSGLQHHTSGGGAREFNLPMELQMQMADQEEEHKAYFSAWPLRDQCEMIKTPSGHSVPQNTYILY